MRRRESAPVRVSWLGLASLLVIGWCAGPANGQVETVPESPDSVTGLVQPLPGLPTRPPRPQGGPNGLTGFVESVSNQNADAVIEVVLGRPRILTLKEDLGAGDQFAQITLGDQTIADFDILSARQLRIRGLKAGVTDMVIITPANETFVFRIQVVYDLDLLRAQLQAVFPDASLRVGQIREHVVIEGQARDTAQVARILETVRAYLQSMLAQMTTTVEEQTSSQEGEEESEEPAPEDVPPAEGDLPPAEEVPTGNVAPREGQQGRFESSIAEPQVINLITVPGTHQVMLKVRVAELNRTALRRIGARFTTGAAGGPNFFSSLIGPAAGADPAATITGVFDNGDFNFTLTALRSNGLLKIMAEPNLVTLSGHQANFLAGGEFPYLVPQPSGAGVATFTVEFRQFGVLLAFLPHVLDHERVRLTVRPEVSQLDFANAVEIADTLVPGLNVRRTETTVEMRQGQTLAIAGVLSTQFNGNIRRVPFMGDLPIIGPFFSDNSSQLIEKELLITVTPYLAEPMNQDQVTLGPGDEVHDPNDLEFFLLGRLEGRVGRDFRATTKWDDPLDLVRILNLEKRSVQGCSGFSE